MQKQPQTYQVIPRKFRPQTFKTILGQEAIVTTLKNALRFNRLAHAYLFCGCRGTGKTTLARVFAKALNCRNLTTDFEPCNACSSCTEILSGKCLDVLEIDGASNRGIDDIRQINETIGYAPASGRFKIYIIDEVHMLTKEAFNALLKTLEEPPASVKFFFATTEPHKVLPTIMSRCQRFDLNRIAQDAMEKKLAYIAKDLGVECDLEALSLIAHLSEGSLRDAESLFDQVICYAEQPIRAEAVSHTLGLMPKESFFALDEAIAKNQCSFAFELSQTLFSSGKDLSYFLDHLLEHFRTLLLVKFGKPCFFLNSAHQEHYKTATALYSEEQCLYILDYLIQWQQQISKSSFKRIGLEMILLHLIRSKNRITFGALVKKLSEIQSGSATPSPKAPALSPPVEPNKTQAFRPVETEPSPVQAVETPPAKPLAAELLSVQTVEAPPAKPLAVEPSPVQAVETPPAKPLAVEPSPVQAVETPPAKLLVAEPLPMQALEAPSVEQMLLDKVKSKLATAPTPAKAEPSALEQPQAATHAVLSRYETLVRFAAVELEAIIKK